MQRLRPLGHTPEFKVLPVTLYKLVCVSVTNTSRDTGSCDATASNLISKLNKAPTLNYHNSRYLYTNYLFFLLSFSPSHFCVASLFRTLHCLPVMDTLVAQYSQPKFQHEGYSHDEEQELTETLPPLSLKFALPPVDKVSLGDVLGEFVSVFSSSYFGDPLLTTPLSIYLACRLPSSRYRRP